MHHHDAAIDISDRKYVVNQSQNDIMCSRPILSNSVHGQSYNNSVRANNFELHSKGSLSSVTG